MFVFFQAVNNKIKEMGEKLTDLKYQVRHELMRNENIEKVSRKQS
jgi:hypothetical protein